MWSVRVKCPFAVSPWALAAWTIGVRPVRRVRLPLRGPRVGPQPRGGAPPRLVACHSTEASQGCRGIHTYIENNQGFIPHDGERYRAGEWISTGFVESTVNQVVSKHFCTRQQMQWTKRTAHLLLQMRVKMLNHDLRAVFRHWYPDFPVEDEEEPRGGIAPTFAL